VIRRPPRTDGESVGGGRVVLRPLEPRDHTEWRDVRLANREWLEPWEPLPDPGAPDPIHDPQAFRSRCAALSRHRNLDSSYHFGVFVSHGFVGELSLQNVQRGAAQTATVGYWVDRRWAGQGIVPEACVVAFGYAFDELHLHRLEIAIVPRNTNSRRVMDKLEVREEGLSRRFLQINGEWEDHVRYGMTAEEWFVRRSELWDRFVADPARRWVTPQ
jgi:[ribosomal protein S5]-alanine N-acetyltransferase